MQPAAVHAATYFAMIVVHAASVSPPQTLYGVTGQHVSRGPQQPEAEQGFVSVHMPPHRLQFTATPSRRLHSRVRACVPFPHVTLQVPQPDQSP